MFPKRYSTMRLIIYVTVIVVFILAGTLFHDTYSKLNIAKGSAEKCTQLQESLSAQLQVVYEHKSRLEKTLQQEKANHKHTEGEFQTYKSEAEAALEKEKQEANNRYSSLKQQSEILQNQHSDIQAEFDRLQQENNRLLENKQKLQAQTNLELAKVREEKDAEILRLQEQLNQANNDKVELQMSNDNAIARLKNAENKASSMVKEDKEIHEDFKHDAGELQPIGNDPAERGIASKFISQGILQRGDINTRSPETNFQQGQRQFPHQNLKEFHEQIGQPKQLKENQFTDGNRIDPNFNFNRQMGGQKIYFPNQEQRVERQVNQDYPKHFAAQPHDLSHQGQQFQQGQPIGWNKRNNLSIQQRIPVDRERLNDFKAFGSPDRFKDVGPMPQMNKEFKNYLAFKKKGEGEFKEAHKQVPRPHVIEKPVKKIPVIEVEKPVENVGQVAKPDMNQEQLENVDQSVEDRKIENLDQVAKPLLNQQHMGAGVIPNIAAPQLAENDEETLLHAAKKDEQQDFDDVINEAGDTQEKEEYKDQEDDKNLDEKENNIKRDM